MWGCNHEWEEESRYYYIDYSGFRVLRIKFVCSKCGRHRVRKFW